MRALPYVCALACAAATLADAWKLAPAFFRRVNTTIAPAWGDVAPAERRWLVALYRSTGGRSWRRRTGWLRGDPCRGEWHGVRCARDAESRRHTVTSISLPDNHLRGEIPDFVDSSAWRSRADATYLAVLGLRQKGLPGDVTQDLVAQYIQARQPSMLPQLKSLDLSRNANLRGAIPATIGALESIRELDLALCNLVGELPETLGRLATLEALDLAANALSGPLPPSIARLAKLESLTVAFNFLDGPLNGTAIAQLRSLREVNARQNLFAGAIPAEFGELPHLRWLDLGENKFLTGGVPQSVQERVDAGNLYFWWRDI